MAGPVSNSRVSSNRTDEPAAAGTTSAAAAPPPPPRTESSSLEQYSGTAPHDAPVETASAGSQSGQQLAAEHQQVIADRAAVRDALAGPLARIAKDEPNGPKLNSSNSPGTGQLVNALNSDKVMGALSRLPKHLAEDIVLADVRKAWPNMSPEEASATAKRIVGYVNEHLLSQTAFAMRDQGVRMMQNTAESLGKLAENPTRLRDLGQAIASLENGTAEQREVAANLRASLGLGEKGEVRLDDVGAMSARIAARSKLIKEQAKDLRNKASIDLVFRTLNRLDLGDAMREARHIKPGSWADQAIKNVKLEGENSQKTIDYLEIALDLVEIIAAPEVKGGALAVKLLEAGYNATKAAATHSEGEEHVAFAGAAEASGVMREGSTRAAEANARMKTAMAVAEIVLGEVAGRLGGKLLHPIGEKLGQTVVLATAKTAEHLLETRAHGSAGFNALERAGIAAAADIMGQRPSFVTAFAKVLDSSKLSPEEQVKALVAFYAAHGTELERLGPDEAANLLAKSLPR